MHSHLVYIAVAQLSYPLWMDEISKSSVFRAISMHEQVSSVHPLKFL